MRKEERRKPGMAEILGHCAELANASRALEKCSKLWLIQQKERKRRRQRAKSAFYPSCVFCLLVAGPLRKMDGDFVFNNKE